MAFEKGELEVFGYIKLYKEEMKLREIHQYHTMYCSLCNQLKKDYGIFSRFFLSYDITFLLVELNNMVDEEKSNISFRCPYNPIKHYKNELSESVVKYCAFINYWLIVEKLEDDSKDNPSKLKRILKKILLSNRKYKKAYKKYSCIIQELKIKLNSIYKQEALAKTTDDFDDLSNMFGSFFSSIFDTRKVFGNNAEYNEIYEKIFFQIGKWIYIMDAFDDYQKDVKKKNFNLLALLFEQQKTDNDEIYATAYGIHLQICKKVVQLSKSVPSELDPYLDNFISYGMSYMFFVITKRKYAERMGNYNGNDLMEILDSMGRLS